MDVSYSKRHFQYNISKWKLYRACELFWELINLLLHLSNKFMLPKTYGFQQIEPVGRVRFWYVEMTGRAMEDHPGSHLGFGRRCLVSSRGCFPGFFTFFIFFRINFWPIRKKKQHQTLLMTRFGASKELVADFNRSDLCRKWEPLRLMQVGWVQFGLMIGRKFLPSLPPVVKVVALLWFCVLTLGGSFLVSRAFAAFSCRTESVKIWHGACKDVRIDCKRLRLVAD